MGNPRYQRGATAAFKSFSPPYDVPTGQYQSLTFPGVFPYVALMQVAAEDTHTNYLICRGYDTREKRYIDYEEGNPDKPGIAVAKPYGVRGTTPYTIGEVYAAVLPLCELGQNPGKASVSTGHPISLTDTLEFLLTDEGTYINWMLLEGIGESGGTTLVECCLTENHPGRSEGGSNVFSVSIGSWDASTDSWTYGAASGYAIDRRYGTPYPDAGAKGLFEARASDTYGIIYDCVSLDCESPGDCED